MKRIDKFLERQREKIQSSERLEKKIQKELEMKARKADELFGPEEEREGNAVDRRGTR